MQLQGTIKYIGKLVQRQGKDGKTYPQQKILLTVLDGNYSNTYPIDLHPKLQDHSDQWSEGQPATVHINMRGSEYTNKTTGEPEAFLSLQAWKVETAITTQAQQVINAEIAKGSAEPMDDSMQDLPF